MAIFIFLCWYSISVKDSEANAYKCKTKTYALKGIIDQVYRKSGYSRAHVKGMNNWISLTISETIKVKGFPEYYSFEVGDSIIKIANSKEYKIVNGEKYAIHVLSCED